MTVEAATEQGTPRREGVRPLAMVTGASHGIGRELAKVCAHEGFDVIVAADDAEIEACAVECRAFGVAATPVLADLATEAGIEQLVRSANGYPVDVLIANAGQGLGEAYLDQDFRRVRKIIDTNITGTLDLLQRIGRDMRERGEGRILVTGSIAGFIPGAYQAVYNASKAFIDNFSFALRAELADRGVTVTCLMPGATETDFFERAGLTDTKLGAAEKADPAKVARDGFRAMMRGDGDVVSGWMNKLRSAIALVTPSGLLARAHARQAKPGSAEPSH